MQSNPILDKILPNAFKNAKKDQLRRLLYISLSTKHLGIPYKDFQDMPIYVINILMEEYQKEVKRENKANKKK